MSKQPTKRGPYEFGHRKGEFDRRLGRRCGPQDGAGPGVCSQVKNLANAFLQSRNLTGGRWNQWKSNKLDELSRPATELRTAAKKWVRYQQQPFDPPSTSTTQPIDAQDIIAKAQADIARLKASGMIRFAGDEHD